VGRIAVEDIVTRHYRDVYRYLARTTGSRDLAQDMTQEVFLRIARAGRNGDEISHERGWVFSIARSVVALDRRQVKHEQVPLGGRNGGVRVPDVRGRLWNAGRDDVAASCPAGRRVA